MNKNKINVFCISDGKPGHANQTAGLLKVLGCVYQINAKWVSMGRGIRFFFPLLRLLLNRGYTLTHFICIFKKINKLNISPAIIISSGKKTIPINVYLSKYFNCYNYFIGETKKTSFSNFTVIFTTEKIANCNNNFIMKLPPMFHDSMPHRCKRNLYCLLIGGKTRSYLYTDKDWQALAEQVNEISFNNNVKWLISTSRRTSPKTIKLLKSHIRHKNISSASWCDDTNKNPVQEYVNEASRIYCTEDSVSMIAESLINGQQVVSLYPGNVRTSPECKRAKRYEKRKLLIRQNIKHINYYADFDQINKISWTPEIFWEELSSFLDKQGLRSGLL